MKKFLALFVYLLLFISVTQGQRMLSNLDAPTSAYKLVLFDDFKYEDVNRLLHAPDSKWHSGHNYQTVYNNGSEMSPAFIKYTWNWPVGTLYDSICKNVSPFQAYCYSEDDISLLHDRSEAEDKVLALNYTYYKNPIVPASEIKFNKTSGLLELNDSVGYGVYEIKCKLPRQDGLQAAFWVWGYGREIDVFETYFIQDSNNGQGDRKYFSTIQPNSSTHYRWKKNPADEYHIYQLAWTPTTISWFVDGYEVRTDNRNVKGGLNLVLSAHYMWSCAAPGVTGSNNYCQPKECQSPNDPLLIDYIKIYKPKNEAILPSGQWPNYITKRNRLNFKSAVKKPVRRLPQS
ncbi:glycoside hydrolase family 16 protein [Hymenobacter volaticus]|uniref:Glycoside hydrolase family 16 protein n=1 Tax=Hymenobacter volaticus TaxID=2932254 RepID=A0ABY4G373_9BACT|nr:glycoside hydrolase family 16 protein [Hymenobacter volaticus]UOQ65322.1 glycoside hydrolase family 16 protein [Hymenobacter volaticus]